MRVRKKKRDRVGEREVVRKSDRKWDEKKRKMSIKCERLICTHKKNFDKWLPNEGYCKV